MRARAQLVQHAQEEAPLAMAPPAIAPLRPAAAAATVFVAAGAVLVLEILSVHLLTPYVGLTLETTSSIIGAATGPLPPAEGKPAGKGTVFDQGEVVRLVAGATPLRDDYAPVDALQTR